MTRVLYELHGRDGYRFSPYSWRTIFALLHKGLAFERVPMKFTDRTPIAPSGQDRVPVLVDGSQWISDSWLIACHLDEVYPAAPSLFGGTVGRAEALFINKWADLVLHAALRPIVVPEVISHTHPDDRDWFRQSREAMFGMTLEDLGANRDEALRQLDQVLEPVRAVLATQPYLSGQEPAYADFIVMGSFMWARCSCPVALIDKADAVHDWRRRMLSLFDGYGANAPGYDA